MNFFYSTTYKSLKQLHPIKQCVQRKTQFINSVKPLSIEYIIWLITNVFECKKKQNSIEQNV